LKLGRLIEKMSFLEICCI